MTKTPDMRNLRWFNLFKKSDVTFNDSAKIFTALADAGTQIEFRSFARYRDIESRREKLDWIDREIRRGELIERLLRLVPYPGNEYLPLEIAGVAAELAAIDLRIEMPRVKLADLQEAEGRGALGWVSLTGYTIYVKPGLCGGWAARVGGHEIKHHEQILRRRAIDEAEALDFERSFQRKYLPFCCSDCN